MINADNRPDLGNLLYHPENLKTEGVKTWRDFVNGNWYYTSELLKIYEMETLIEEDVRVVKEIMYMNTPKNPTSEYSAQDMVDFANYCLDVYVSGEIDEGDIAAWLKSKTINH